MNLCAPAVATSKRAGRCVRAAQYEPPPGLFWDDEKYSGDAYGAYAWAVYVAEVAVDTVTFEARVTDFVAVQEVGKVIHPVLAAGQIEGGVAQAIGMALYENVVWRDGRMANGQMTNYIMPTAADIPPIRVFFEENPYPFGPHGAKGIGELPMDGPAPAILNAIENATGICVREIPATPEILTGSHDGEGGNACLKPSGRISIACRVNGEPRRVQAFPMARLLDVLREEMHLTGTKEGCGEGECGACAVLMNGALVNSCLIPAVEADGAEIRTIEGMADGEQLHAVQQAFLECGGAQCGICTPGMVIAAVALLERNPHPNDAEIREGLAGNLCRCTGYQKIFAAVVRACESSRDKRPVRPMRAYIPAYDLRVPGSLSEALALMAREPGVWQPFAGGTDLMVLLEAGKLSHKKFLSVCEAGRFARHRSVGRFRDSGGADHLHRNPEASCAARGISAAVFGGAGNRQHRHAESRHAGRKYCECVAGSGFPAGIAGVRR